MKVQIKLLLFLTILAFTCNQERKIIKNTETVANDTSVEEFSYQGDYDNQIVDAVNSAKVNVAYNNCLSEDSFGGTQIIEVTNVLFSLYTLRGDYYRNPVDLILNMYS